MRSRICKLTVLGVALALVGVLVFDRLKSRGRAAVVLGDDNAFDKSFNEQLRTIGQISPGDFAEMFPPQGSYRLRLSFEPTTAKYHDKVDQAFPFLPEERATFRRNGFVVSERLGGKSFAEVYYRIFFRDLPVFISADSVLHAWHRSYDAMLAELEEEYLAPTLIEILANLAKEVPAASKRYGDGVLGPSLLDADYFLAVARSLLERRHVETMLGQDERVAESLRACESLALQKFELFGRPRVVDFSQFKVRGHYENSPRLQGYFKAMMWCGRIDLRIAGGKNENDSSGSPRELGAAVVLNDLLNRANKAGAIQDFDRLLQTFVGRTDSMTFTQLNALLSQGDIASADAVKSLDTLAALQQQIMAGKLGLQHIRSDAFVSSNGPSKIELPRSFTFLGQKFVIDSWATAKLVFDDILWDDIKVQRRIPSALDVAFSVLGNDHVVPDLVARMNDKSGRKFRDGLNYQHNLAAVRRTIDGQNSARWHESLYTNWLATLRELSKPTTGVGYPEALQTRAWAMKSVNTQLASWTQMRHDTILYAKQSYTARTLCEYPTGFVEPIPHFWERLERMANRAAQLIESTPYPGWLRQAKELQQKQVAFFHNFARQVALLKSIAVKQAAQQVLTADETSMLKDVVQLQRVGSGGETKYNGWYPKLCYQGSFDSGKEDALVADVHTNVPDPNLGDPGCVLTQGVGHVDLLVVAIDNGKDRLVYLGPLLSHYAFEMPGTTRMSDSEWKSVLSGPTPPSRPDWTKSYLVPRRRTDR